jgi:serine/threonine protein kinase/Flp pilus assembly protein TadD
MNKELSANTTLSHYRIVSKIGAGGMGEVFLAEDMRLRRQVALKVLPESFAANVEGLRRFEREAHSASALNHPNILTIYEFGVDGETHFLAAEYVRGETLRQRLKGESLSLRETLDIAAQVAAALNASHAAGIVHRDIKPENIMLRGDGLVKVLDFGLAKLTKSEPKAEDATQIQVRTSPGQVLGTALYMSPEQARGKGVDSRSDVWSLGVVLYEMLTGRTPFAGETSSDSIAAILTKEPLPLDKDIPRELQRIVRKSLQKKADERYQTVKDLQLDLQNLKHDVEFSEELERSQIPGSAKTANVNTNQVSESAAAVGKANSMAAMSTHDGLSDRRSSAEYLVEEIKGHKWTLVTGLIVMLAIGLVYWFFVRRVVNPGQLESIAVLPFQNASNDAGIDYLADGISESLINSLTELQQLKVIARSTAFRYKAKEVDAQTVGRELDVRAVLMGRIRQAGDRINIQVDLVDASNGAQLWGEEYERSASDVLTVKQTIAREVTAKLRLRLTGEQQQQLTKRDTTNPEAYQFYLRGRYYWNKRTAENLKKAIQEFQQALDRDPNFALGYVGVADCYLLLQQYAGAPASEALPQARAALERALQIDGTLAEAHASLGMVNEGLYRWAEAEEEFKRAISLNPNYPTAHHWLALSHLSRRQFDDALSEMKRAQELDPLSPIIGSTLAMTYLLKSKPDLALAQCKRVIELEPNFPSAHLYLGWSYTKLGRNDEALAELEKAVEFSGRAGFYLEDLGYLYAVNGRRKEALAILKELQEKNAKGESSFESVAAVYSGLGDRDQVFAWLEKGFQAHDDLTSVVWWFDYDDLRSDPRYADLVRRTGL